MYESMREALNQLAGRDLSVKDALEADMQHMKRVMDLFDAAAKSTAAEREARLTEQTETLRAQAETGEIGERSAESGETYSLKSVAPVEPTSDNWERSLTTEEAMQRFPNLWNVAAEESETRNPTQIKGTVESYRKIYDLLKNEGFNGTILDASSGLGYGTRAGIEEYGYDVEDIEPYPGSNYQPKYKDYSKLNKKYDVIISNAVLNVLPQDQRDALTVKMGQMLNDGGRLFVNVRGKDVLNASSLEVIDRDNLEVYISKTGSYQKGFTKNELVSYLKDALGDGFDVETTNRFGAVSAVVTKTSETKKVPKDNAYYSSEEMEKIMDSFGLRTIWDYRHVQDRVFATLLNEGFFDDNGKTTVKHESSGIDVVIDHRSIDEAFDDKNYAYQPVKLKIAKLHTIRHIKNVIKNGNLGNGNVRNYHKSNSKKNMPILKTRFTLMAWIMMLLR